jgi:hypothetical protein
MAFYDPHAVVREVFSLYEKFGDEDYIVNRFRSWNICRRQQLWPRPRVMMMK